MVMKKYIVLIGIFSLFAFHFSASNSAQAQKPKAAEFTAEGLPDELLEYMNKQTQDGSRHKENSKLVKGFRASYTAMDNDMQRRVVAAYSYGVKAKMKANPDMGEMTRVLTAYATAPGGGQNLEGWMQVMELYRKTGAKAKALTDFVDFSDALLKERVLYSTNSSRWTLDAGAVFRLAVEDGCVMVCVDVPENLHYTSELPDESLYGFVIDEQAILYPPTEKI